MLGTETLIITVISVLCFGLGFIILLNNFQGLANRSFFGLAFFIVLWIASSFLETKFNSVSTLRLLVGFDYGSAPLIGFFFYLFALNFPEENIALTKKSILAFIPAVLLSVLSFSTFIAKKINVLDTGISIQTGSLYIPYVILMSSYIVTALTVLIVRHSKSSGEHRKQILFVLIGFFVTGLVAISTNLVFSRIFNPSVYIYGIYSVIIFISFTAYSIIKHKMLDIKLIATEVIVIFIVIVELIQTLLSANRSELALRIIFLAIVVYIGYLLIRSVQHEIQQKEKIQKLAKDLEVANNNLKELDKVKDDFLSMASHELNTPIAAIEGYLSMILVEKLAGEIPAKAKTYLDSVYQSSQRLAHLVRDLLNVSRIESNRIHLLYEEKSIEDIINQAIMEITPKVREAKHTLTFEKPTKPLPKTWMDITRITEIMINIIGNSIKYTEPGGKIDIKVITDDNKIVVSVEDNGRGIPKDRQSAIFEKFTQADVLKDQAKGTGLGMYISKRFIELHGGKIWFHSDGEGKGTTFFFSLPIVTKKPFDPHEGEGAVLH